MGKSTNISSKSQNIIMLPPSWLTYGVILFKILQDLFVGGALASANACHSPCCNANPVGIGDGVTIGIALAGDLSLWYNNSDTGSNLLSPCGTDLAQVSSLT